MSLVNDIMLVTRVRMLHDNKAFDSLVVKYQQPIRRFFLNQTLGNEPLSDDLAQDTFIKAYRYARLSKTILQKRSANML